MNRISLRNIRAADLGAAAAIGLLLIGFSADGARLFAAVRERIVASGSQTSDSAKPVEFSYGKDPLQKLDYWRPAKAGSPLVVFVHGGAWTRGDKRDSVGQKPAHYLQQGYGFASINYRLVPANTVEQQAQDVASAIAYLTSHAQSLGFDKQKVVLMGHSAGAHLAALVGTDMRYLKKAGLGPKSLSGIVALDGACYDVPRQVSVSGKLMHDTFLQAFGTDRQRQIALSPTYQASAPNAPAFLILHVQRPDGIAQSKALAEALEKAGTSALVRGFAGRGLQGHTEINRRLGDPSYPATPVVDDWLKSVFAEKN